MKFTLSWLKKFLDTEATIDQISDGLFRLGLEVEEINDLTASHHYFKIAEIIAAEKHPDADSLKCCKVNNGEQILDIVCGAANARKGIKVVLAPIAAVIPANNMVIKESLIRGQKSQGMLCSYAELNLIGDSEGIIELPLDAPIGTSFSEYQNLNDPLIDISVTPNRADCLGIYGIARDLAAIGLGKLKEITLPDIKATYQSPISVKIHNTEFCHHFAGRHFKNIRNIESPKWLKDLLSRIGQKPISALVDITNYINLSFARPLHVYDATKLEGNIHVRNAWNGEEIMALNHNDYKLTDQMLVVADENQAQAIAGVIGGQCSSCSKHTTEVFLESAYFTPSSVLPSGRKLNILSDSRYRFERGIDPSSVELGNILASQMILEICGGEASEMVIAGQNKFVPIIINFDLDLVYKKLGIIIEKFKIIDILQSIGCKIREQNNHLEIIIPSHRGDITIAEDLIEEIARINDYANITPIMLPPINNINFTALDLQTKYTWMFKRALASFGFDEVVSWSFMKDQKAINFSSNKLVEIINPITSDLNVMRPSIIPNLLDFIKRNELRSIYDQSIFDCGSVYNGTKLDQQPKMIAAVRSGMKDRNHYLGQQKYSCLDIKADIFSILSLVNLDNKVKIEINNLPEYYHPARSGSIMLGNKVLGYFGELHPKIHKLFELKQNIAMFELNLDELPYPKSKFGFKGKLYSSDYQPVERRFSFIIKKNQDYNLLWNNIRNSDKSLIKQVKLFDYLETLPNLADDEKILGFSVILQSENHTLTSEEIDNISNKIIENCLKTGARIRN